MDIDGTRTFTVTGSSYDAFMGRYAAPLAELFADAAGVTPGDTAIDVGCGPGALTGVLVDRLGARNVRACDPSPPLLAACAARFPDVEVAAGAAEALPFEDGAVDHALAQLVLHFVSDAPRAVREMARVVRPGGTVAACVWDFAEGMEMLRAFWDAALSLDPAAPDEASVLAFGGQGEVAALFAGAGLQSVQESTLTVTSRYSGFDELWDGFLGGVGPAGAYCTSRTGPDRERLREALRDRLGRPDGAFELRGVARCAVARVPG